MADNLLIASPGSSVSDSDDYLAAQVQEVVGQLKTDFNKRDRLYKLIDEVVYLEDVVTIPKAYKATALEVHSPQALVIPSTVTAALSLNPPRVSFPPTGKAGAMTVQQNASKREHFFEASWTRQEAEAERQLFRAFMWSTVTYGEGILKTVERVKSAWALYTAKAKRELGRMKHPDPNDEEYAGLDEQGRKDVFNSKTEAWKQGLPYPITTVDVDPSCFYYLKPPTGGFSWVAEVSEVPYFEALERFSTDKQAYTLDNNGNVRGMDPTAVGAARPLERDRMHGGKTLTLIELWNWKQVVYVLLGPGQKARGKSMGRGTVVKVLEHGYGNRHIRALDKGPYFHAQGITTNSRLPHRAGLSVLLPYLEIFPQVNALLTQLGNSAYLTGFPAYARDVPPGAGEPPNPFGNDQANRNQLETKVTPGTILPWGVKPIEQPRAGVDLDKFLERLQQFLEPALPRILQGAVDNSDSGYLFNQAAYVAKLGWTPIVGNAEVALSRRTGFESWLIEQKIKETVYVQGIVPTKGQRSQRGAATWLSLSGKDDLYGVHTYTLSLDPETPSNKIIQLRWLEGMLKLRLTGPYSAMQEAGQNPDEVEEEWLLWEIKNSDPVHNQLIAAVFQELGTIEQKLLTGNGQQGDLSNDPVAKVMAMIRGAGQNQAPPGAPLLGVPPVNGQPAGVPAISDPGIGAVVTPGAGMPVTPGGAMGGRGFAGGIGPPGPTPGAPGGVQNRPSPPFAPPGA